MSLVRAFTTRRGKLSTDLGDASKMPLRSNTTKTVRHKISAPMELVHTTNMLSYNAPDLPRYGHSHSELGSPRRSEDDSSTLKTNESTPPTSPDMAPGEAASNHLSTYFTAPRQLPGLNALHENDDKFEGFKVPVIPTRSPSHTKKASQDAAHAKKASYDATHATKASYDAVHRQRSTSNMSRSSNHTVSTKASMTFSRSSSTSTSTSTSSYLTGSHSVKLSAPPMPVPRSPMTPVSIIGKESHPFGQELAQVTELVEEYVIKEEPRVHPKIYDEDEEYILSKGLAQFSPADYLFELDQIASRFFPGVSQTQAAGPLWI